MGRDFSNPTPRETCEHKPEALVKDFFAFYAAFEWDKLDISVRLAESRSRKVRSD
jgi:hypothetical protein